MTQATGQPVSPLIPALLIAASSASVLSTDLYAPSLPHLPALLSTDASTVTLTMSLNLASFALAQLIHGPLADRFGRRPVFLMGMAAFLLTAVAAAAAQSIEQLIAARILMGAAASVEAVVALAVIRDLYDEAGAVKLLAIYGMVIAIAPAVGPVIGGFVFVWAGWRANFLLLAGAVALVFALSARWLPETTARIDHDALGLRRIIAGYAALLGNRIYLAYALALSFGLTGVFAFVTAAPFVLISRHGVATQYYGFSQMAIVAAYFIGTMIAGRAVGRIDARRICA
ncbi:MAG: Bcr/CflA family efflux MFS transporter, partial [Alphaproteobacteria bacterium]|nr:Bcr/CflA family efflux MFS transporter [Alphaproteobacteria bacterium]